MPTSGGSEPLMHMLTVMPLATGLAMVRWLGATLLLPVFTRTGVTRLLRGGVAFAMAVPAIPAAYQTVDAIEPARFFMEVVLLTTKEFGVGVALGLLLGIPFWAAELAGSTLDVQRGSAVGTLADPEGASQSSILGTFFMIISIALFLAAGGMDIVVSVIYDSYLLWPLGAMAPDAAIAADEVFVGLLQKMTVMAVILCAPLIVANMLSDLLLGFVARLAPQLHIDQIGAAVKSLLLAALMVIYATFSGEEMLRQSLRLHLLIPEIGGSAP